MFLFQIRHLFRAGTVVAACLQLVWMATIVPTPSVAQGSTPPPVRLGAEQRPEVNSSAFQTVFSDIAEKVVPTVVSVIPTIVDTLSMSSSPFSEFFGEKGPDNPLEHFFGPRQNLPGNKNGGSSQQFRRQGLGSGIIVSKEGHILTNYHVIAGAAQIDIKLHDGREFSAKVSGSDSASDIAVLKIVEKVDDLPVAFMGNSDALRPGDWVVAIGNPFSLSSSVTVGIVSAIKRHVGEISSVNEYIQTDAAINPGNSGGALVNLQGEIVGINTLIYTQTGGYMGIGFAIPINAAQKTMNDLVSRGRVIRGWIGVSVQNLNRAARQVLDLRNGYGILVADIYDGQPAHKAGLRRGDVILSLRGVRIASVQDLRMVVTNLVPGEPVSLVVLRNGIEVELSISAQERQENSIARLTSSSEGQQREYAGKASEGIAGIGVTNLNPGLRRDYGLPADAKGILVTGVDPKLYDSRSELRPGDLITEVKVRGKDFTSTHTTLAFRTVIDKVALGDPILIQIMRNDGTFYIAFSLESK